ncbi:MAG: hypothetical protein ACYTFT_12690, partial [Planctomycetota bacterium]
EGQAPTFVPTAKTTAPASNRVSVLPIGWVDAVKQTLMQTRDRVVARRNAAENVQEGPGWTEPAVSAAFRSPAGGLAVIQRGLHGFAVVSTQGAVHCARALAPGQRVSSVHWIGSDRVEIDVETPAGESSTINVWIGL